MILGRVSTELKKGMGGWARPTHRMMIFYDPDKTGFLNKYCTFNILNVLPFPMLNYVNPLLWPCFFEEDHASEDSEDIQYREKLLEQTIRKLAAEKGSNVVVGFSIGGVNMVSAGTGAVFANMSAWSANGYAIILKK